MKNKSELLMSDGRYIGKSKIYSKLIINKLQKRRVELIVEIQEKQTELKQLEKEIKKYE